MTDTTVTAEDAEHAESKDKPFLCVLWVLRGDRRVENDERVRVVD